MSVRHLVVCAATALLAAASPSSAQELTRVSVATGGAQANDASGAAVLSSDGRFVAFVSNATNLVASDANASPDVFVRDLTGATTTRVSLAQDGLERSGNSGSLSSAYLGSFIDREIDLSADGRFVVFTSRAALVAGDTNSCIVVPDPAASNCPDIYLRDRQTSQTTRLSEATGGANANGASRRPRISADGRWVAFESDASNLVAADTNGVTDVFLLDRQTGALTRVSQATGGGQADSASTGPSISDDGSAVAFLSASAILSAEPDAVRCERAPPNCRRAFVHDRVAATTRKIQLLATPTTGTLDTGQGQIPYNIRFEVGSVDLSADGSSVAVNAGGVWDVNDGGGFPITTRLNFIYYRALDRHVNVGPTTWWDGRRFTYLDITSMRAIVFGQFGLGDIVSGDRENIGPFTIPSEPAIDNASGDGLLVLYSTLGPDLPGDTNAVRDVYLQNRDRDGDGLPTSWEARFGFDSSVGGDGAGDADGDGLTNAAEYQRGSHPRGTFVRYLAEGASNGFFTTTTSVANLGTTGAVVVARFLGDNGLVRTATFEIAAGRRQDLPSFNLPASSFATTVESDALVVVDRLMTWGNGYGSSAETAITAPASEWFLAEGATHGRFELFYLLQNPGTSTATVDITYLRPAPAAPLTRQYTVGPESRLTIPVDTIAELAATDVSARIVSSAPILVERSMYMDVVTPAQVFGAGHAGAGISAVNTRWFLAEGATGVFFDLYYLLANPSTTPTRVRVSYLLPTGAPIVKEYNLAAQSRLTISVDGEDVRLTDTPVSAIVESLDAVGIVVERSMWWPGGGNWQEGHLSAGTTTAARRWGLAAGQVGGDDGAETYVLIANPTSTAGTATVTLLPPAFGQPVTRTVPLAPNSRVSIPMSGLMTPELQALSPFFAAQVESDGPDIVVERAIYSNANGIVWAAGSVALGTPLP